MDNSRFKFRVWDKECKCWHREPLYRYQSSLICNMLDAGLTYDFGGPFLKRLRFELVQSTGLLDCEGNIIFEGDILEYTDCMECGRGLLVWSNLLTRYRLNLAAHGGGWHEISFPSAETTYKIIGNRFENPELLEVKE